MRWPVDPAESGKERAGDGGGGSPELVELAAGVEERGVGGTGAEDGTG